MPMNFDDFVADAKTRVREVSVGDVQAAVDGARECVIVDVREEGEYAEGHIPGALHVGRGVLEMKMPKAMPDAQRAVVCYCGGGARSALAADRLQQMGYADVASMAGGMKAWRDAGGAVET